MISKSIPTIILGATANLRKLQYRDRTIDCILTAWREFQRFCEENEQNFYSSALKDEFIVELNTRTPPLKPQTIIRKIACMKMLDSFSKTETWIKGNLNPLPELQPKLEEYLSVQDSYLAKIGYSECTRETMRKGIFRVLMFFQTMGVTTPSEINSTHISAYILTLSGHAKSTVRGELSRLRQFFEYLYLLEYTTTNLSQQVPSYHYGQSDSLVKIWELDEIEKVIEVVDRANPKGKRDAAYIIIASELGMRSGDIRNLKLSDIDWEECTISFNQSKTGKPNTMPMSEKVGEAIIDYLYIRPKTESEHLFVSLIPPYGQMNKFNTSFHNYTRRAGIKVASEAHHGLHSLRATVATKLLSANVSPDIIFPFLGHSDRESLNNYLRFDIENLRDCALSFEGGELI